MYIIFELAYGAKACKWYALKKSTIRGVKIS